MIRAGKSGLEILAFRHPQAGLQIVRGTVEPGEPPALTAMRELEEETGIAGAVVLHDLGTWDAGEQLWAFFLVDAGKPLPEQWSHYTLDDGGYLFAYFWQPLNEEPGPDWHPVFAAALRYLRDTLSKQQPFN